MNDLSKKHEKSDTFQECVANDVINEQDQALQNLMDWQQELERTATGVNDLERLIFQAKHLAYLAKQVEDYSELVYEATKLEQRIKIYEENR